MTLHLHIFFQHVESLPVMVVPKNAFLCQAVKIMAKKSTSKHLLSSHKSPLDHSFFFLKSCNFTIYDIKMKFGNLSIAMWNVRMGKCCELPRRSPFGSNSIYRDK